MSGQLSILFPSGDPNGLRVIEKSNWIGQGLVFPRDIFDEVRKREEFSRAGVYILWSPPGESNQLPRVYVGESDNLRERLGNHDHNKEKDFWTDGAVFTSKDRSLNKAHVLYLEARLLRLANDAKRCKLENVKVPQRQHRRLEGKDKGDAEEYLTNLRLCLQAVDIRFFERPSVYPASKLRELDPTDKHDLRLHSKDKGAEAWGYKTAKAKEFVVRAGATAVKNEAPAIRPKLSRLRKRLIDEDILEDTGTTYRLVQDYTFNSPSQAASVLMGTHVNGLTMWRDAEGQSLKKMREAQAD